MSVSTYTNLKDFVFNEVIGGHSDRKVCFFNFCIIFYYNL